MNPLRRIDRLFQTVRHNTPQQLFHRIRKLGRQKWLHRSSRYQRWLAQQFDGTISAQPLDFHPPHVQAFDIDAIREGRFTFLNKTRALGHPIDWFPPEMPKLWIYNLHYFEYAPVLASAASQENQAAFDVLQSLIESWIQSNARPTGPAWDAYPVSLRICNWIKAYSILGNRLSTTPDFAETLRRTIAMQTRFLEDNLEYDLMNNHLLENGRALFNAGCFFLMPVAERWRRKGMQILMLGLREHFLDDGAHDELSPMYHQIMLELYQELRHLLSQRHDPIPELLDQRIDGAQRWLAATLHPDGRIALLNDAAHGIAGNPQEQLEAVPCSEPDGFQVFSSSQLACFRNTERGDLLITDNGRLGPDRLPGHGHCDNLSYELSLSGKRFIVDSGVEQYHEDEAWRNYYRGTRAHNTVVVDGKEQSEIWGAFRVARRAKSLATYTGNEPSHCFWSSAHNGYVRGNSDVIHRRWITWVDQRFWVIVDQVTGSGDHHVQSFLHFHPEVTVPEQVGEPVRRGNCSLTITPFGTPTWQPAQAGEKNPPQGWYAPEFGLRIPNVAWSLGGEVTLPAWFGYVLWPHEDAVHVTLEDNSPEECRLLVREKKVWQVDISSRQESLSVHSVPS